MTRFADTNAGGVVRLNNLNAYAFSFDDQVLDQLRGLYKAVVSEHMGQAFSAARESPHSAFRKGSYEFGIESHNDDVIWITSNNLRTYQVFKECFDALNIAESLKKLVDHDERIMLYCGFFVVSHQMPRPAWHVDYAGKANAYTLLAPLLELEDSQGNLLYKDAGGNTHRYRYQPGKGVLVGDKLLHTTEPYPKTEKARVLLSMTVGTDKMEHWDALKGNAARQFQFLMLPCGHVRGSCNCLGTR